MSAPPEGKVLTLDLAGLKCPLPVLKLRRAMQDLPHGVFIEVIASDPMTRLDVPQLVNELEGHLVSAEIRGGLYHFVVQSKG